MGVIADHAIVIDDGAGVDDHIAADDAARIDRRAGHHHAARADSGKGRNPAAFVHAGYGHEAMDLAQCEQPGANRVAAADLPDADDCAGKPEPVDQRREVPVGAQHGKVADNQGSRRDLVDEPGEIDGIAGSVEHDIRNRPGVTSSAENDDALSHGPS